MRKFFISFATIALAISVQAQSSLDYKLRFKAKECNQLMAKSTNTATETISVIGTLKDGVQCPTQELQALGVKVVAQFYGLVVMQVNTSQLEALGKVNAFSVINADEKPVLKNDQSHVYNHVADVQDLNNLPEGLRQIYTGNGVLVGVVDEGFDFQHRTFKDEAGNTRIKRVWQPTETEGVLKEYNTAEEIEKLTTDSETGSHGTHTTATAAGSYNGEYTCSDGSKISGFRGAAYEADILLMQNSLNSDNMIAITKMWEYARSQKKPLVVNMSLGTSDAWMDGKNEWTTFFKGITKEGTQDSLLFNLAAGNEGWGYRSFYKKMAAGETLKSRLQFSKSSSSDIMFCSEDATPFSVTIKGYNADGTVAHTYTISDTDGDTKELFGNFVYMTAYDNEHDGRYFIRIKDLGEGFAYIDADYTIEVSTEKACGIRFNGNSAIFGNTLNGKVMEDFYLPNDDNSLNNMVQHKYAFAVGAYTTREKQTLYNGSIYSTQLLSSELVSILGGIGPFSSWVDIPYNNNTDSIGIDFLSPGNVILSAINHYDKSKDSYLVAKADDNNLLGAMLGTSMATPNATGLMALWLQACPDLSISKVREIIKKTADNDDFTKVNPRRAGFGKINCLAGLQEILKEYPTAISEVSDNKLQKSSYNKFLQNGQIIIEKNGKRYNAVGQEL